MVHILKEHTTGHNKIYMFNLHTTGQQIRFILLKEKVFAMASLSKNCTFS